MTALETAQIYHRHVRDTFGTHGKPDVAQGQIAYMRHQFDYFGLKMPAWTALTREIHQTLGLPDGPELIELARLCFQDDQREMQYFAIETVEKMLKKQPAGFIDFLEEMILEKSWWDSVDWIAKLVGMHFQRYPDLILPVTERWMASGELWLQRVCLIFQLRYKEKTDADLLFRYIRLVARSKEFFLQKGAGWALRQYSKTNPEAVRRFLASAEVSPLTRREGSKYL
ncbi:MAG: DNA alkylation repair protein [Lewinellaceae bacterium]|nr:DNA alkylation repair protein [Saprospiraceae bacterium]MCB9317130.1 DNA alkylation repair protein [Lewinellaceae bacterium]MCB9332719.1 DNA alkylation repair protein [Lewinellaceae bacterium]